MGNTFTRIQNFIYTIFQYKPTDINSPNNIEKKDALLGLYIDINKIIERLILFVNNIAIMEYNINVTPHYQNLVYAKKNWTKYHAILLLHLKKLIPINAIKLINIFCNNSNEYLYWFPLSI